MSEEKKPGFRWDGWLNVITGLGVKGKDKRMSASIDFVPMVEVDAESLYAADDIASRVVDLLPREALREGFDLVGVEKKDASKLLKKYQELDGDAHFEKTWRNARMYGGGGLFMVTADSAKLDQPMRLPAIVSGLTPMTRWELFTEFTYLQRDLTKPNFGLPTKYRFQPRFAAEQMSEIIDASRIIRFDGAFLPERQFIQNNYWHDSVLNKLQTNILNFSTSHDAAATIIQDFRIAIFKIKNLADQIASGDDQAVIKRIQLVDIARSVARAVVVDAEGEDFEYKTGSIAGLKELLDKLGTRLVAGTDIPHTILLGESPTGSNATGNSTTLSWYDYVASQQNSYLKPKHIHLFKIIASGLGIELGDAFDIVYKPLWQMDEKETVATRKTQAESDQIYFEIGALDSKEIRESRFGGDKYSVETELMDIPQPSPQPVEPTQQP